MDLKSQKSQSTTEFLIVLSVIIATVILAAQDILKPAITRLMNDIANSFRRTSQGLI